MLNSSLQPPLDQVTEQVVSINNLTTKSDDGATLNTPHKSKRALIISLIGFLLLGCL